MPCVWWLRYTSLCVGKFRPSKTSAIHMLCRNWVITQIVHLSLRSKGLMLYMRSPFRCRVIQQNVCIHLRGSSPLKSAKSAIFVFSQKKGLYMWVHHFPEYYEASSTENPIKSGLKWKLSYTFVLILSMCFAPPGNFGFSTLQRIEVCSRAC